MFNYELGLLKNMPRHSEEFNFIEQTQNPPVPLKTAFIWILSSRHTVTGTHINCPVKPAVYQVSQSHQEAMTCDVNDDFERIRTGLKVAQAITAKKANKNKSSLTKEDYEQYGPCIIYNGLPDQNRDLLQLFSAENNVLDYSILPHYPSSKFIIFELPANQMHTGGQFNSLISLKLSGVDKRLDALFVPNIPVTIVTSAYHAPRTKCYLTTKAFKKTFPNPRVIFFVSDRAFQRPCVDRDCEGEIKRIKDYTEKGDIGEPVASNWYDIASLRNWTPLRALDNQLSRKSREKSLSERLEGLDLPRLNKLHI